MIQYSRVVQQTHRKLGVTEHIADLGRVHEAALKEWMLAVAVQ